MAKEYMFSAKSVDEFQKCIQHHEINTVTKYVFRQSSKSFDKNILLSQNLKLHWHNDIPYFHFGSHQYVCHQGPDINTYQKKKYLQDRDEKAHLDHVFTKRRFLKQVTKKLDCPASIDVIRVYKMPEYKINGQVTKRKKETVSSNIKRKIAEGKEVTGEEAYLFNLPEKECHKNHLMEDSAAVTEPVDRRIREKVAEFVRQGKRNPAVIIELLESYVEKELLETDRIRRRFYPDTGTIRKIISDVKIKLRSSKMDIEDTDKMLQEWDKSGCSLFFRPCTVSNDDIVTNLNNDDIYDEEEHDNRLQWKRSPEGHNSLLFVYQSNQMKHLYSRYGSESILLDATYKVCKYAVPLYFLVVRTNVSYQIVGVFITQFETKEALVEALEIIKIWNPDVFPRYAMVDYAAEEISALEQVFVGIKVFICIFHREQAWTRWLSKRENACVPKEEALKRLRKIANVCLEELESAVDNLKSWEFYSSTPLKKYFEHTWQGVIKRWTQAWKPQDLHFNTNNGVERLNEELKYRHLGELRNCLLSEIIKILIDKFLPQQYAKYVSKNVKLSSYHMKYNTALPKYLHNRPTWFVDHVKGKLSHVDEELADTVQVIDANKFSVPSMTNRNVIYTVEFDENMQSCSCTCASFMHQRLLCKHVLLVGIKHATYSLENIQSTLLSNPVFRLDECVAQPNNEVEHIETFSEQIEDNTTVIKNAFEESKVYGDLKLRKKNKTKLMLDCNSTIRSIQSIMHYVNEETLFDLSNRLKEIFENVSSQVTKDDSTGLPVEPVNSGVNVKMIANEGMENSLEIKTEKPVETYSRPSIHKRKKSAGRVGAWADMQKKARVISVNGKDEAHVLCAVTSNKELKTPKDKKTHISTTTGEYHNSGKSQDSGNGYKQILCAQKESALQSPLTDISIQYTNNVNVQHQTEQNDFILEAEVTDCIKELEGGNMTDTSVSAEEEKCQSSSSKFCEPKKITDKWRPSVADINEECNEGIFLTDKTIDYAQSIIREQEKSKGFQSTVLGQRLAFDIARDCIQILHNGNDHWVTVKILNHCTVELYDSLGLQPTQYLQKQISSLVYNNVTDSITVKMMPVQAQRIGSNNCGPLAIAFAFSLARGENPCNLKFNPSLLRSHLQRCLLNGKFTEFPQTLQWLRRIKPVMRKPIKLYCICRSPSFVGEDSMDAGLRMAQCSTCASWLHQKCDPHNLTNEVFLNKHFIYKCQLCNNKVT